MNILNKTFKLHSDCGHAWLAVKKHYIEALGISKIISSYSYEKGGTVYLEEDADLGTFFDAFKKEYGVSPKILELKHKDRSAIRHYNRYIGF